jgi:hypothetical protein
MAKITKQGWTDLTEPGERDKILRFKCDTCAKWCRERGKAEAVIECRQEELPSSSPTLLRWAQQIMEKHKKSQAHLVAMGITFLPAAKRPEKPAGAAGDPTPVGTPEPIKGGGSWQKLAYEGHEDDYERECCTLCRAAHGGGVVVYMRGNNIDRGRVRRGHREKYHKLAVGSAGGDAATAVQQAPLDAPAAPPEQQRVQQAPGTPLEQQEQAEQVPGAQPEQAAHAPPAQPQQAEQPPLDAQPHSHGLPLAGAQLAGAQHAEPHDQAQGVEREFAAETLCFLSQQSCDARDVCYSCKLGIKSIWGGVKKRRRKNDSLPTSPGAGVPRSSPRVHLSALLLTSRHDRGRASWIFLHSPSHFSARARFLPGAFHLGRIASSCSRRVNLTISSSLRSRRKAACSSISTAC